MDDNIWEYAFGDLDDDDDDLFFRKPGITGAWKDICVNKRDNNISASLNIS